MALVLVLLSALAAWRTTRPAHGQSTQLADGSRSSLEAVTYGKEQRFVHGTFWEKLILQATPEGLLKKQGPLGKFTHLSLQKLNGRLIKFRPDSDSLGHSITNIGTAYTPKAGRFFFYEIGGNKTNPRTLDLTMAIHPTRYFSFLAKPSRVATNQSSERK